MRIPSELRSKLVLVVLALAVSSAAVGTAVAVPMIRSSDIVNETILSEDIKNGTIQTADLASGVIPPGDGIGSLHTTIKTQSGTINSISSLTFEIDCDAGQVVVGGGYDIFAGSDRLLASENFPKDSNTWRVVVQPLSEEADHTISAYAVCASIE